MSNEAMWEGWDVDAPTVERAIDCGDKLSWWACSAGETDDGLFRFVASTGDIDRHGDIVDQSFRFANFKRNPVILYEHRVPVVGRAVGVKHHKTESGEVQLRTVVRFHESETNPLGMLAGEQHREGYRSAVSVGFIPGTVINRQDLPDDDPRKVVGGSRWDAGSLYKHNELLEISTVGVPANAKAIQERSWALEAEDPAEQLRRILAEAVGPTVRGVLVDAIRADDELRATVRTMLLGTPPVEPNPAAADWWTRN